MKIAVNDQRKGAMGRKVIAACGGAVRGRTIALLGLAFKPNTEDMRDSPSIAIIQTLVDAGAKVRGYHLTAEEQARMMNLDVDCAGDAYTCAEGAHALVVVTGWDQFRALDLKRLAKALASPVLVDLRNVYRPEVAAKAGLS